MKYCPVVVQAKIITHYQLLLTFSNHELKVYDCSNILESKRFSFLKDYEIFCNFKLQNDTISWSFNNVEYDIDPCEFYDVGKEYLK